MPKLSIDLAHKLSKVEVQKRVKSFIATELPNAGLGISNLGINWNEKGGEFFFKVTGVMIKGNLFIDPNFVNITSNIPLIFLPLKGQIEKIVKERAAAILK